MRSCHYMLLSAAAILPMAAAPFQAGNPIVLFNGKDLTGWTTFIPHTDNADPATDPKGVFRVENGLIHVSGEEFGCLTTTREFDNYRLLLEFRWGEKRYPPREQEIRDSGVLLHCVKPEEIWPKCIECQIQEGDCGDFWMVEGAELTVRGKPVKDGRAAKDKDAEKPSGEWNTIEVICDGDSITNIVNGVVVNRGTNANIKRGHIVLQSEGAEVYYRKVQLYPLTK